jgi:tRNA G18 (ribose-2'-O)-methylase SpoU
LRPLPVADPDDPRVALFRGVRDPELLRDHGVFIAEGRLVVQRLIEQSPFRARSVLVTPAALGALGEILAASSADIFTVSQDVMDAIAGFNLHRGCLAVAERAPAAALDALIASPGPLVVLENVGNPDNVGGAFRNAAAFGASGVVLSPGCCDPLYRKAIRTSMAATLTTPFAFAEPWPGAVGRLRSSGWQVIALAPAAGRGLADAARDAGSARVALLLGHEGHGLSAEAEGLATSRARIPMAEGADSLNVATAAAVALYELRNSHR